MIGYNFAQINLDTLAANYRRVCEYSKGTQVICVVKADAYGHGAVKCVSRLYKEGCRFFAVSCVAEALEIKPYVSESEILILGVVPGDCAEVLIENNIITALASLEEAKLLSQNIPQGKKLRVHIKLDTGMNRIGFEPDKKGIDEILTAYSMDKFDICGMFTHFALADTPDKIDYTNMQFDKFMCVKSALEGKEMTLKTCHVCNSAGTMLHLSMHLDGCRAGIILYGLDPSPDARANGLKPVMTLKTHIVHTQTLKKGESVGYGATFTAEKDMQISTLPIGYADGFIRAYKDYDGISVNGTNCKIVGRICMDQCMIDTTGLSVEIGDEVILFGGDSTAEDLSRCASSIPYETVCLVSKRVPRVYIGE